MNYSYKCICGETLRRVKYKEGHPKNDDPRLDICQVCGHSFEEE